MTNNQPTVSEEKIESNVFFIRGQKVVLSTLLAEAYAIELDVLHRTIENNIEHFPEKSLFRLIQEELDSLKLSRVIPNGMLPYAFTGQGAAMLSSILFDERAMHESLDLCAPTCDCRK
jgi:hypothetical protein